MKRFLNSHNDSFRAEWLKLKRTGIFWLCIASAAFIPILITVVTILVNDNNPPAENAWRSMMTNCLQAFTGFFFPLFLVITMVRIVYLEHRSDTWKLMETQPVSRLSLYIVKYEVALLVSFLCLLCLLAFALIGGFVLQFAKPEIGFSKSSIDWTSSISIIIRYWVASFGIIAVQYFLSLLIKSFAWPLTIGLIGIIIGSMMAGFGVATWFPYSPFVLTSASVSSGSMGNDFFLYHEKLSMLWGLLFLVLGYILFRRRGFVKAFFTPFRQLAQFVGIVAVFGLVFWWINKPIVLDRYNKTILAGKITSDIPGRWVQLLKAPGFDTVLSGPVVNGSFKLEGSHDLPKGIYMLRAASKSQDIYFGGNDSLFIEITTTKKSSETKITGTRIAENEFLRKNRPQFFFLENYAYDFTPARYVSSLLDEWKSGVKKLENFKTVGNVKPAADFIGMQKKLLAASLLNLADNLYPRVFAVYSPNDSLKYPKKLDKLRAELNLSDSSLLTGNAFLNYVAALNRNRSAAFLNSDSAFLQQVLKISSPQVREAVLFNEAQDKVTTIRDSARRAAYIQTIFPYIRNPNYRNSIDVLLHTLANVQRGYKAPDVATEALNGKEITLTSLAGRYIIIDVWATWCGPCKKESPFFDELAETYTSERVAFVSLSIDENKDAWKIEASEKTGRVLKLWVKGGPEELQKKYAISSIPRFMFIDPRGNIISAQMPRPSDPEFENILRKELRL